ncbi:MAG: DUF89 family protein [Candidatus Lokiarchaeota archaeon]|nr:DUF89 family protein [Candidatus Lokiarchaeota archaeon]
MVKVSAMCGTCLINRAIAEIEKTVKNKDLKFEIIREIFNYFSDHFDENSVPSNIGTIRDRIIRDFTNKDPYKEEKRRSNELALDILPNLENMINKLDDDWEKFFNAVIFSIVGNIMEFDIVDNMDPLENIHQAIKTAKKDLAIDDTKEFYNKLKSSTKLVFLADNAGELVFDKLLIKELSKYAEKITVIVKQIPVLNDATMKDAEFINLTNLHPNVHVITSETDHVGIIIEETPDHVMKVINNSDLIIAKGMGYFETLTEYKIDVPIVHLFRIKCKNISEILNVDIQKNVILYRD